MSNVLGILKALRIVKPEEIFVRMPLYLSVVCVSSNFNTGPLGTTFLVVCLLMVPAYFSMRHAFLPEGNKFYLFASVALYLLAIILSFGFTTSFGFLVAVYAVASWLTGRRDSQVIRGIFLGFLPVLVIYIGLNGYELYSLVQVKLLSLAGIWLLYFTVARKNESGRSWFHGMAFQLMVISLYFILTYLFIQRTFGELFANRMGLFLFLPILSLVIWSLRVLRGQSSADSAGWHHLWRVTVTLGLTAYFFWLFVAYTNVLQVFS